MSDTVKGPRTFTITITQTDIENGDRIQVEAEHSHPNDDCLVNALGRMCVSRVHEVLTLCNTTNRVEAAHD